MRFESHLNAFWDLGVVQMAKCSDLGTRELGTFKELFSQPSKHIFGCLANV